MSASGHYYQQDHKSVPKEAVARLRANKVAAVRLPDPAEELTMGELNDRLGRSVTRKFAAVGIIEKGEYLQPTDHESDGHLWSTNEHAHEWVAESIEIDRTPCGNATGVRNLGDGEFTCLDEDCGCRFDRDVATEVVG